MSNGENESRLSAPYVPVKTLTGFLDELRKLGLPEQIDRSVMPKMSGNVQKQVAQTLRFLDLTDDNGVVTAKMKKLIQASGDEQKVVLGEIVESAYSEILGSVSITNATVKQLSDRLREAGKVDGDTNIKAQRFLVNILKDECGKPVSPHLLVRQKRSTGPKKPAASPAKPAASPAAASAQDSSRIKPGQTGKGEELHIPEGMKRYPLYFKNKPDGGIIVPESISLAECKIIELVLRQIEAWAAPATDSET